MLKPWMIEQLQQKEEKESEQIHVELEPPQESELPPVIEDRKRGVIVIDI